MQVLITGASGFLGSRVLARIPSAIGWHHHRAAPNTVPVDITDARAVDRFFAEHRIDVCIHCAANPNIDSCEAGPAAAHRLNVEGTRHVARQKVRLIHISTDYVFDGALAAYIEEDPPAPLQVYGRTKAEAEAIAAAAPGSLIVRLPLLYAAPPQAGALDDTALRQPTHVDDVAAILARLVDTNVTGILHVAANKGTTKYQWALRHAPDASKIHRAPPTPNRPLRSWLSTDKLESLQLGVRLRTFDE